MKVYKSQALAIIEHEGQFYEKQIADWNTFLNRQNLFSALVNDLDSFEKRNEGLNGATLEKPM